MATPSIQQLLKLSAYPCTLSAPESTQIIETCINSHPPSPEIPRIVQWVYKQHKLNSPALAVFLLKSNRESKALAPVLSGCTDFVSLVDVGAWHPGEPCRAGRDKPRTCDNVHGKRSYKDGEQISVPTPFDPRRVRAAHVQPITCTFYITQTNTCLKSLVCAINEAKFTAFEAFRFIPGLVDLAKRDHILAMATLSALATV